MRKGRAEKSKMSSLDEEILGKYQYVYNLKTMDEDWARAIVFIGEGGKFVHTYDDYLIFIGGFMGNNYNFKIG